jgi:hypothetical protein
MKKLTLGALVAIATTASVFAQAGYQAKPGTFDPDKLGIVSAAWVNKLGLPDGGGSSFGLLLAKDGATTAFAAAGASITGVEGIKLTELGFDYKNGGHCGGGAPRFNVEATDGSHFMGGCSNGTQSPSPAGADWTRVRIDPQNPAQAFPVMSPTATVISITVIFDEGTDTNVNGAGSTVIDNIDINGILIMKPGTSK